MKYAANCVPWAACLAALALAGPARAEIISPADARAIRSVGGGGPFLLQPGFLSVQSDPGFLEDRTAAVFDLGGLAGPVPLATLDLDLVDLDTVRRMLDEHRNGVSDHSRRLWTVLIFMLWHAIFVEGSVVPQISEPVYPVQL